VPFQPQLDVAWERGASAFLGNLSVALGPRPHRLTGRVLFYDFWMGKWSPGRAFVASVLVHIAVLVFPVPNWRYARAAEAPRERERVQLTYFGPARDLPPLIPSSPRPRGEAKRPAPVPGRPTAVNPRQTIVSNPLRINHPRQTLIQPQAPPTPPKILPPLPNMVQWSGPAAPARPRPVVTPLDARRARRTRAQRPTEDLPLPQEPNSEIRAGDLNIAASAPVARARLPVQPMSVPKAGQRRAGTDANPAPEVGGAPDLGNGSSDGLPNLIALSADPAPPSPNLEIPLGNLSARFATGPSLQPGVGENAGGNGIGAGSGSGTRGGSGGDGTGAGGGSGPPGISISGGNPENTAPMASPAPLPSRPLPARPQPRGSGDVLRMPEPALGGAALGSRGPALGPGYAPSSPEVVEPAFGIKRTYTLHINMPNLTSAAGSWILRFAELNPEAESAVVDLTAPVPMRKVDPRYPPVLIEQRIEGHVRLYAIIRANGSVDSIEVQRGLHPELDRYSMEALAQWKFRPAGRNGKPVDVEAVITIPFRLRVPR